MNRSMIIGTALGIAIAATGAVMAGYALRDDAPTDADTTVAMATETPAADTQPVDAAPAPAPAAAAPAEECWDEVVTHQADPKDEKRIAGTVIGAVVGGVVGNQFGGGSGKKLATVAGAAGGGYAGNQVQKKVQDNNTYTTTERRCRPVDQAE
jgi:uncharacterized protein YcfJ